jgi:hypothetical protein
MTFDARGDGYALGEGAGVLVLKRLSEALRDRDRMYAVLRGSGVNQDGQTPGISFPEAFWEQTFCDAGRDGRLLQLGVALQTGTVSGAMILDRWPVAPPPTACTTTGEAFATPHASDRRASGFWLSVPAHALSDRRPNDSSKARTRLAMAHMSRKSR